MANVAVGLASVAGGGKFDDGAATAAFGYLFNQMMSCPVGDVSCMKKNREMRDDMRKRQQEWSERGLTPLCPAEWAEFGGQLQDLGIAMTVFGLRPPTPASPFLTAAGSAIGMFGTLIEFSNQPSKPSAQFGIATSVPTAILPGKVGVAASLGTWGRAN